MAYRKVLELENEIEAGLLASVLEERKIPCVVRRNANPALEGFFQRHFGWGWLEADEGDAEAIREIYADLRAAAGKEIGEERPDGEKSD